MGFEPTDRLPDRRFLRPGKVCTPSGVGYGVVQVIERVVRTSSGSGSTLTVAYAISPYRSFLSDSGIRTRRHVRVTVICLYASPVGHGQAPVVANKPVRVREAVKRDPVLYPLSYPAPFEGRGCGIRTRDLRVNCLYASAVGYGLSPRRRATGCRRTPFVIGANERRERAARVVRAIDT